MNECRMSEVYEKGVYDFLQYVLKHAISSNGTYFCPCVLVLIKYVRTWAQCLIIYSSLV